MNLWIYIIGGLFAALGLVTFVRWILAGWQRFVGTINILTDTLKDAAEVAKAYREDVQILKQIAQSAPTPNFGEEPESIIPKNSPATMPTPYWGRYPTKPDEPDAPVESASEVDMTPSEEDLIEQERNHSLLDFETQERQKAANREADQARLRELTEMSGEPEGK